MTARRDDSAPAVDAATAHPALPGVEGAVLDGALLTTPAAKSSATQACSHCALPVPAGRIDAGADVQFCCEGCETVWSVLHEHGLDRYYDFVEDRGETVKRASTTDKSYAELDDPAFADLYARRRPDGLPSVELYLEGVHCSACVWLVEKVPVALDGVAEVRLDLRRSMAEVTWDPATVPLSRVARFLDSLGYPPRPYRAIKIREMRRQEDRALLIRIAVAGAAAGNVMLIAFALYGGMFESMETEYRRLFHWVSLALTLPAALWAGGLFFRGAWAALRTRTLHMDLPIALGLAAGLIGGTVNTLRGEGHIYFDSVSILVFLLLVGRWIQNRQQRSANDAAELLYSLAPTSARVVAGDTVREVPVEALLPGAIVEVRAGDSVPADGVVSSGASDVDASLLTGESRPVPVQAGDAVHAGTVNLSSRLLVRVEEAGERTRVGRLMHLVEEGARRRAPLVRMADRISGVFVAAVLALAVFTALLWAWLDPSRAIDNAIALLIVTCPCALGLATPLAVSVAIGRAAQAGILIKGGDALERMARPGQLFLDKTGTLTEGRTALVRWLGDRAVGPALHALEAESSHPIGRAIVAATEGAAPLDVDEAHQTTGGGIVGRVAGRRVVVGSPAWVTATVGGNASLDAWVGELTAEALTPVAVAVDGAVVAALGFGDPVRPEARRIVDALRARGWQVGILSGDHPQVVRAVGRALNLPDAACLGAQSPEAKLAAVEAAARSGPVVMVGDGVNDAAALSAASVGIGVHGGAEASLATADVYLTRPGLDGIEALAEGAQRTVRVIRRNLVFSLCYNLVGVSLCVAGHIDPLAAAVLMPASSLTVLMSSLRARTFGIRG